MTITIHQPNFVPWYPFFEKMQQADIFILLGNCQYEKSGYQNRFNFAGRWNTLSVRKGFELINSKVYTDPTQDWNRIKVNNPLHRGLLEELDCFIQPDLYTTNVSIIKFWASKLGIKTKIVGDYPTELKSTARLVDLCRTYGATTYLAGQGGKGYLDESEFEAAGIQVVYQKIQRHVHTLDILK